MRAIGLPLRETFTVSQSYCTTYSLLFHPINLISLCWSDIQHKMMSINTDFKTALPNLGSSGIERSNFFKRTTTPRLTTNPLTTTRSSDQNFLKNTSVKSHIRRLFNLLSNDNSKCGYNVLVITTPAMWTIVCSCNFASETQLISIRLAGACIFHLIPYFRLTTTCSESILFVNWGVSLPKNKLNLHSSSDFETLLNSV
jgi:hypothetical protein